MFCFQKAIITFSILLVSSACASTNDNLSPEARLTYFQAFLKTHIRTSSIPKDSASIRFESLIRLPELAENFWTSCLEIFEKNMKDNELSYSSKNAGDLVKLGQLSFETLDQKCKDIFANIQTLISKDEKLSLEANAILLKGDVLDFLAFLNNPETPSEDMKAEIKRLKKIFTASIPNMEDNEATMRILLHKYNKGYIREDYPKPVGNFLRNVIRVCSKF